jgi:hypothetical protein
MAAKSKLAWFGKLGQNSKQKPPHFVLCKGCSFLVKRASLLTNNEPLLNMEGVSIWDFCNSRLKPLPYLISVLWLASKLVCFTKNEQLLNTTKWAGFCLKF